ncbi:MAG: hypothetical protein EA392_13440 [Cryomorphaceae bacterium]|nr:MAG: hypothetical protein EA392_13440 [Cryomorphaceae bacterium]
MQQHRLQVVNFVARHNNPVLFPVPHISKMLAEKSHPPLLKIVEKDGVVNVAHHVNVGKTYFQFVWSHQKSGFNTVNTSGTKILNAGGLRCDSGAAQNYFYICSRRHFCWLETKAQALIGGIFRKQLFQNTLIFSGSSILNRAIPFLLAPIITRYLTPEDYGTVANFISLLGLLIVFAGVNTHGLLPVKYYQMDREQFRILVGNLMFILVGTALLMLIAVYIVGDFIADQYEMPFRWVVTAVLCALAMFMNNVNLSLWQLEKKARWYATFTFSETLVNVGLSLYLIIALKMTWEGRLLGVAISLLLFGILSLLLIYLRGFVKFRFHKLMFTEALAFGIPLIPHNLSGWLRTGVNFFIITSILGSGEAGLYNLGSQFALIVFFIGNGFNLAVAPLIYEKLSKINPAENLKLVRIHYLYFAGMILAAIAMSVFAPLIIWGIFPERYHDSTPFIPWLSFAFAMYAMYYSVVNFLFFYKKTLVLSVLTFTSGLINTGLCYWLVDSIGAIGAAQASLVSFLFMFVSVIWYTQKVHPLPWGRVREALDPKKWAEW